jgi:hypothetical protein
VAGFSHSHQSSSTSTSSASSTTLSGKSNVILKGRLQCRSHVAIGPLSFFSPSDPLTGSHNQLKIIADGGDATSEYDEPAAPPTEGGDLEEGYESSEVVTDVSGLDYLGHADAALLLAALVPLPNEDGDDNLEEDEGGVDLLGEAVRADGDAAASRNGTGSGFRLPGTLFCPTPTIYGSPNLAMDIRSCDGSDDPEKSAITGTDGCVPPGSENDHAVWQHVPVQCQGRHQQSYEMLGG